MPEKTDLKPLESAALSIVGKRFKKKERDQVDPCSAKKVDLTVRITGAVDVGEDCAQEKQVSPTAGQVLAVLLRSNDSMGRQKICNRLRSAFSGDCTPDLGQQKEMVEETLKACQRVEDGQKKGAVTGSLAVSVVSRNGKPL